MARVGDKHGKAPGLGTKELKSLDMLVQRTQRFDAFFFCVAYAIIVGKVLRDTVLGTGNTYYVNMTILGGIIVAQILLWLFGIWMIDVRSMVEYQSCPSPDKATHCKVTAADFTGKKEIVFLDRKKLEDGQLEISFEFRKQRFHYVSEKDLFEKLAYPVQETFGHYQRSSGYGNEVKAAAALDRWGPNRFEVPVPQFGELLKEQLLAPFFVFQVFCVGLWCLDDYWYYSLFTLGMLVMFECTVVGQRLRNLRELRSLTTPKQALQVYRQGKWVQLPGDALLPGDVISIGRPSGGAGQDERVVPADALLLAGTCIVEEAVLTGESTPQWKNPIGTGSTNAATSQEGLDVAKVDPESRLSIKRDKNHVLFSGTKILQHTGDKSARIRTPDNGCLAVVLRTGFETSQGQLMRTILYSTERVTANNWEVGLFILFLLIFAVAAAAYVLYYGLQNPDRDRFKLLLNCTMIITSVIPPELPMELSIAVNASLLALARKAVFCTEPFRIPLAGKVAVCCFDKTGTLTSDNMVLKGLVGLAGRARELVADVREGSREAVRVLAACQSLIQVDGQLVGDPLERAAFQATGWAYAGGTLTSPKQAGSKETATILHRFHFTSTLKRMAVVVKVENEQSSTPAYWAVVKGAPEVIQGFLAAAPADYEAAYKVYAAQGGRVIALAYKKLDEKLSPVEISNMPREEIESGLQFAAFAIFQCPLKEESEPALRMLKDASHQLVMITGDAPLTACHAASQVHILDRPVLILVHRGPALTAGHEDDVEDDSIFEWTTPDEGLGLPFERSRQSAVSLAAEWDLCISGDGLHHLQQIGAEADYIPLTQVFARVSPDQKELILRTLRSVGWTTLMCGDGTNDVGALKTAHVGVALLTPRPPQGKDVRENGAAPPAGPSGRALAGRGGAAGPGPSSLSAGRGRRDMVAQGGRGSMPEARNGPPKKLKAGEQMLEKMRQAGKPVDARMQRMADWMDSMEGDNDGMAPMVKPGDASMASPFTAKLASVMPCTDIIRQGRSTLVTTIQMFKILGLICLSTAYSLSVMYLQGVKLGDFQATVMGMLSAMLFFVISHAKPLDKLSPQRPHPNIFSAYVFLSLLGQFAAHMVFLIYMYYGALAAMSKDEVQEPNADFKPNLVNTVCFLVQFIIQLITFGVNYQGPPFNTSIRDTMTLRYTFWWGSVFWAVLSLDLIPELTKMVSLVSVPPMLGYQIVGLGLATFAVTYGWDHLLRVAFPAPSPPQKGYLAFKKELAALKKQQPRAGSLQQRPHAE
ncbi:g147 [Coccomyxa elongata]